MYSLTVHYSLISILFHCAGSLFVNFFLQTKLYPILEKYIWFGDNLLTFLM